MTIIKNELITTNKPSVTTYKPVIKDVLKTNSNGIQYKNDNVK